MRRGRAVNKPPDLFREGSFTKSSCSAASTFVLGTVLGPGPVRGLNSEVAQNIARFVLQPRFVKICTMNLSSGVLRVWDLRSGGVVRGFCASMFLLIPRDRTPNVFAVDFGSGETTRALVGTANGSLNLWNVTESRQVAALEGHLHSINALVADFKAGKAASGSSERYTPLGRVPRGRRLDGDGDWPAARVGDGVLKIWDIEKERCITALKPTVPFGLPQGISALAADFAHGVVLSGSDVGDLEQFDARTGESVAFMEGEPSYWSPSDSRRYRRATAIEADLASTKQVISASEAWDMKHWDVRVCPWMLVHTLKFAFFAKNPQQSYANTAVLLDIAQWIANKKTGNHIKSFVLPLEKEIINDNYYY